MVRSREKQASQSFIANLRRTHGDERQFFKLSLG